MARRGNGKLIFNGYEVSVGEDENVLEMDGSDGSTILCMLLVPQNCTLENG